MYIKQIELTNIRSIAAANWELKDTTQAPGWHVILGDNGAGKTSFLRAVALALVGPLEGAALRQDWNDWLRLDQSFGRVLLTIDRDAAYDKHTGKGKALTNYYHTAGVVLDRDEDDSSVVRLEEYRVKKAERYVRGKGAGWFSASYGPFRRFAGGDKDAEKLYFSNPKLARHLSVFGESIALTECIRWLQELQFKKLERDPAGALLGQVKEFVNHSGFLPHHTKLHEVTSREVVFLDGNNCKVSISDLSDGYRSILSMTFELIRQLAQTYGPVKLFAHSDITKIAVPGVVLIDEIDAHLHPSWQLRIGGWFREHFPRIQFIVTTHSPLICHAAEVGTVWRLPTPGTDEIGRMIEGVERERLVFGSVLEAYSTGIFGTLTTRSASSQKRLERLAELNVFELSRDLSKAEREEQEQLRAASPTAAHTTEPLHAEETEAV